MRRNIRIENKKIRKNENTEAKGIFSKLILIALCFILYRKFSTVEPRWNFPNLSISKKTYSPNKYY